MISTTRQPTRTTIWARPSPRQPPCSSSCCPRLRSSWWSGRGFRWSRLWSPAPRWASRPGSRGSREPMGHGSADHRSRSWGLRSQGRSPSRSSSPGPRAPPTQAAHAPCGPQGVGRQELGRHLPLVCGLRPRLERLGRDPGHRNRPAARPPTGHPSAADAHMPAPGPVSVRRGGVVATWRTTVGPGAPCVGRSRAIGIGRGRWHRPDLPAVVGTGRPPDEPRSDPPSTTTPPRPPTTAS
jgi:hypothetical protein